MACFSEFLASLSSSLSELTESSSVHVTVGSEACDLDSMTCALCHAHFLARDGGVVSLPVLQCSRDDFALRTDATWLFQKLDLDPSQLLFIDEVCGALGRVGRVQVTLVDHAHLTGPLSELPNTEVVEVIDHHPPAEGERVGSCRVVVEPVGSCATLVAEGLLADKDYALPATAATLLLGAVLLDTVELAREKGRATDKDEVIAEQLAPLSSLPRAQLFKSLSAARLSTAGLSTDQLLRRDFKCVDAGQSRLGFSSVACRLPELLAREGAERDIQSFCQTRRLSALLLLGVWLDGETLGRQVAVFQPQGSDLADALASVLEAHGDLECLRQPVGLGDFPCILLSQGNTTLSRKHILPLVVDFVSTLELDSSQPAEKGGFQSADNQSADKAVPATSGDKGEAVAVLSVAAPLVVTVGTAQEARKVSLIPEYTLEEESHDTRSQRHVNVGGEEAVVDMQAVQPYRKIIQHGGYVGSERQAVVVISACYLPPRSLPDYHNIVHQLFFYVMSVLQRLVVEDYVIVYLHSGAPQHSMPSITVFHKFYRMIDRRLRKQLRHLYIVHPTFWVRSMLRLARPFVSSKFYHKVHLMRSLDQLSAHVPLGPHLIPAPVARADSAHQPRPSHPAQRYSPSPHP